MHIKLTEVAVFTFKLWGLKCYSKDCHLKEKISQENFNFKSKKSKRLWQEDFSVIFWSFWSKILLRFKSLRYVVFKPWDLLDLRFFGCETFGSLIGFVSKVFLGLSFFSLVLECD